MLFSSLQIEESSKALKAIYKKPTWDWNIFLLEVLALNPALSCSKKVDGWVQTPSLFIMHYNNIQG